jgi:spore germination protein KC
MKRLSVSIILILSLFINGCWNIVEINDAVIVTGLGVELADNGQIDVSAQLAKPVAPQQAVPGQPEVIVQTASGDSIMTAARRITLSLPRVPLWSHSDIQVIGEKLARQDMGLIMDALFRTRHVRHNLTLLIAGNATPGEIFGAASPLVSFPARGMEKTISFQEEQLGIYVPITQREFFSDLVSPGVEPVAPRVIISEESGKKRLLIDGSAVFKGRKMIGLLNEKESRGYSWLRSNINKGGIIIVEPPAESGGLVTFEVLSFKSKSRPVLQGDKIKMKLEIEAEITFYEENAMADLLTAENQAKLEKLAADKIAEETRDCITKAQELNSDILGWGRTLARYQPELWNELQADWNDLFPSVDSEIQVKTQLKRSVLRKQVFQFKS